MKKWSSTSKSRVSNLLSFLAFAYLFITPVHSECCYSYTESRLPNSNPKAVPSYIVSFTGSSWTAANSSKTTYNATISFSPDYFIEWVPQGCTLTAPATVSCSITGKSTLDLTFQKITATVGGSYSSSYSDSRRRDVGEKDVVAYDLPPAPEHKPPKPVQPQPPPTVGSVQICGEFCTLSTSCSISNINTTTTIPPGWTTTTTASTTRTKTTSATTTITGRMVTPPPTPETPTAGTSNKAAVIVGSIFAVVVVAFAVGYAVLRRNMAVGGRTTKKGPKELDQGDVKYTRPMTPAPAATVSPPSLTAAMTVRQPGGGDLESQSRFKKPLPLVSLEPEQRAAEVAAASTLSRGRSIREAAGGNRSAAAGGAATTGAATAVGADVRYVQHQQRILAMNADASASAPALVSVPPRAFDPSSRTLVLASTKAPTTLAPPPSTTRAPAPPPNPAPKADAPPVAGSTTSTAAAAKTTRTSDGSDWSAVDTADLEFLIIPVTNNNSSNSNIRPKNPSPPPSVATEAMEDIDLEDGGWKEEVLLRKSKSVRFPSSSGRGGGEPSSSSFTTNAAVFADTSPLRRASSAGVVGSIGSRSQSSKNANYRSPYYQQQQGGEGGGPSSSVPQFSTRVDGGGYYPQQHQQQQYRQQRQQQQQGWAHSHDDLLTRARSMPKITATTTATNGGFPPRMIQQQDGQQQQRRPEQRGLYGYL
ncbi:hypothetical protein BGX29_004320 [Mortierella sp. GBA35]|nr:hypothetical protein BGX29_004320 [Mortierella sp. GBA35]